MSDPITLSPCHLVTLSPCHLVTLSPCHLVTLSPCHLVIPSPPHCQPRLRAAGDGEFTDDHVQVAILIKIAHGTRGVEAVIFFQGMRSELTGRNLFEPDDGIESYLGETWRRIAWQMRGANQIQVTISVQVARDRPMHSRHGGQSMTGERIGTLILEPLNSVVRFGHSRIKCIAVGKHNIQVLIAIEIN